MMVNGVCFFLFVIYASPEWQILTSDGLTLLRLRHQGCFLERIQIILDDVQEFCELQVHLKIGAARLHKTGPWLIWSGTPNIFGYHSKWIETKDLYKRHSVWRLGLNMDLEGKNNMNPLKMFDWWFGRFFIFPYIGNNHPNWRTHIFQRGRWTTNQMLMQWKNKTPTVGPAGAEEKTIPFLTCQKLVRFQSGFIGGFVAVASQWLCKYSPNSITKWLV